MQREPSQSAITPQSLVGKEPFSWERLMSHIDPGPAEESEEFVRFIYEERKDDLRATGGGQTGR
jgi:hypothetical protein